MKRKLSLFAIAVIALFSSCNKDDDNSSSVKNAYRLKQETYTYSGGEATKHEFTYNNERISAYTSYDSLNGEWVENYKGEVSYNGDNFTLITYYEEDGSWTEDEKYEYTVSNGLIVQEIDYYYDDNSWVFDGKYTYSYSGSDITGYLGYDYEDGEYIISDSCSIIYKNSLPIKSVSYYIDGSEMRRDSKDTLVYSDNKLQYWIDYYYNSRDSLIIDGKSKYTYSGDKITALTWYGWSNVTNDWVEHSSDYYSYDENNYLIKETYSDGDESTRYEYESGNGNLSLVWSNADDVIFQEPAPKSAGHKFKYTPYHEKIKAKGYIKY